MHYTIYRVTNLLNNKTYIGKHQTEDLNDGYMGSGKLIRRAIKKHGIENFHKEILFDFDNEADMNTKEKEVVVISEETYNLCPGGKGGFGYINNLKLDRKPRGIKGGKNSQTEEKRLWSSNRLKQLHKAGKLKGIGFKKGEINYDWSGKKHRPETIVLMKTKGSGENNSQFGTCWICNETKTIKINQHELDYWLSLGYVRGRRFTS